MAIADWIPLLQTLTWPVTVLVLVLILRKPTRSFVSILLDRVKHGANITLGKEGLSLTGGEKIPPPEERRASINEVFSAATAAKEAPAAEEPSIITGGPKKGPGIFVGQVAPGRAAEMENPNLAQPASRPEATNDLLRESIYLVHAAGPATKDPDGIERRDITVALDADVDELLERVERVIYHLHPTFPDPNREVRNRRSNFELKTRAWGQFNLTADVHVKGLAEPVHLTRYLSFPAKA